MYSNICIVLYYIPYIEWYIVVYSI